MCLTLKRAENWFLSINSNNLPMEAKNNGLTTHRVLSIEGKQIEVKGLQIYIQLVIKTY